MSAGPQSDIARIDALDEKILALLGDNARMTNKEVAYRIGLSPSACLERVRRLEQAGIILGYKAVIKQRDPGPQIRASLYVRLSDADARQSFEDVVTCLVDIVEAYEVAGAGEFLLGVRVSTIEQINAVCALLSHHAGAGAILRTSVILRTLKCGS